CGGALSVLGLPPCAAPERYPLSLHDALPIWLPTSRTENAPPWRANSACLRETVTSSRKMSLSGCRPQDVRSLSRRNRLPALGPRSEEHTSELQSRENLVCRLLREKKNSRTKA